MITETDAAGSIAPSPEQWSHEQHMMRWHAVADLRELADDYDDTISARGRSAAEIV